MSTLKLIVMKHSFLIDRVKNTFFCIYELTSTPIVSPSKPTFGRDKLSKPTFNVLNGDLRPIQTNIDYIAKIPLNNFKMI